MPPNWSPTTRKTTDLLLWSRQTGGQINRRMMKPLESLAVLMTKNLAVARPWHPAEIGSVKANLPVQVSHPAEIPQSLTADGGPERLTEAR